MSADAVALLGVGYLVAHVAAWLTVLLLAWGRPTAAPTALALADWMAWGVPVAWLLLAVSNRMEGNNVLAVWFTVVAVLEVWLLLHGGGGGGPRRRRRWRALAARVEARARGLVVVPIPARA